MSWGGTVTWSTSREMNLADMNRIEANLLWLYERIMGEVGDVGYYPTATRPRRLLCNGATISKSINPEYTDLVDMLKTEAGGDTSHPLYHADADKAKLPDLENVVVRGMTTGRKAGEFQDHAVGSHAHDTDVGSHSHTVAIGSHSHTVTIPLKAGDGSGYPAGSDSTAIPATYDVESESTDLGTKTSSTANVGTKRSGNPVTGNTASETRMMNVALYPLIKY